ncbi:MAG TPA: hypothetical protein VFI45_06595 [Candidatus Acidoferrum sp.]|nr:hypothetical protein [Candidatus Acidoferrum sp.]
MPLSFSPLRAGSVSQDWRSPLNNQKSTTYLDTLRGLETAYAMFSVNLDEALGLRRTGRYGKAHQALSVAPTLCKRLADPLQILLRAMLSHAKHFRVVPNLSPLDPENFQQAKSRRAASFNGICSRIFLSQRSQFLHKISTLIDLVENLRESFSDAAEQLNDPSSLELECEWDTLDAAHYDLNTCLRESFVLLKCFLLALPDEQLLEFDAALSGSPVPSSSPLLAPKRHLAHRRMTLLKGQ